MPQYIPSPISPTTLDVTGTGVSIADAKGGAVVITGDRAAIEVNGCSSLNATGDLTLYVVSDSTDITIVGQALTLSLSRLVNYTAAQLGPYVTSASILATSAMKSLTFTNDGALTSLTVISASALTTVNITNTAGTGVLTNISIVGAALTAASVDNIIAFCVSTLATGGTLSLNGGTSAAPSGAATANLATLASRAWTVTTN